MVQVFCSNGSGKRMVGHLQDVPHHATPLHNALPVYALDLSTPEDALNDNKPDIFRLQAFSCEAFVHTPGNMCGRHDARSLTSSTSLYCLAHRPSCIIELCNIVLDKGGPTHHHHHHHIIIIILNHDGAPATPAAPDGDGTSATAATPSLPPANSITPSCPRCTTHVSVRNDNPHHTVLPYGSWQANHAAADAAHAADPEDPWSNKGAIARSAKQLAMCKLKKQAIDVVPQPKDRKVIRSGWANCLK
jgi:hypothetical protein